MYKISLIVVASICLLFICSAEAATGSWTGAVSAQSGPSNPTYIPLSVNKRELIKVYVSGVVKIGNNAPWSGPSGTGYYGYDPEDKPPYGYSHGIVMMKINQNLFPIEGGARTLESPHTGSLALYVNDDSLHDNQGNFTVNVIIKPGIIGDSDQDGIPDELEDTLLDLYAPTLLFDEGEKHWPADVYWFLRNSDWEHYKPGIPGAPILSRKHTPFYPEWILTQTNAEDISSNLLDSEVHTLQTDIRNSHRYGQKEMTAATHNTGIYGHVTKDTINNCYVLEYWQFYANNDTTAPFNIADHEGDWELVVFYIGTQDPTNMDYFEKAVWWGHGEELAIWTADEGWEPIHLDKYAVGYNFPPMPQQHPPVYIEANTHGSWPAPAQYNIDTGLAQGNHEIGYQAVNITNIGEVYRPRLGCEVILQYNGLWGAGSSMFVDCPSGPPQHKTEGQYKSGGPANEAIYIGKWNHGRQHPNGLAPLGRISWPHITVTGGIACSFIQDQDVLIYPGTYYENIVIDKAVVLRAPHGDVVIGE